MWRSSTVAYNQFEDTRESFVNMPTSVVTCCFGTILLLMSSCRFYSHTAFLILIFLFFKQGIFTTLSVKNKQGQNVGNNHVSKLASI